MCVVLNLEYEESVTTTLPLEGEYVQRKGRKSGFDLVVSGDVASQY